MWQLFDLLSALCTVTPHLAIIGGGGGGGGGALKFSLPEHCSLVPMPSVSAAISMGFFY